MSSAAPSDGASDPAPLDGAADDPTPPDGVPVYEPTPPDGAPDDGTEEPPRYAPGVGQVPLPPPLVVQPRVFASPPAPKHRGEWRVLLLALIVAGLLLFCFCIAGYVFFLNGGLGASE